MYYLIVRFISLAQIVAQTIKMSLSSLFPTKQESENGQTSLEIPSKTIFSKVWTIEMETF